MARKKPTLGQSLQAVGFRAASTLLSRLPRRLVMGGARGLGRLLHDLMPRRRRVALGNLEATLGSELSEAERRDLARRSFGHCAALAVDLLTLPRVARDPRRYCEVAPGSLETLREALARGRGVLLVAGHFGLMESMGLILGHEGIPLRFVAKPFGNPALDAAVNARRAATGNGFIHKGGAKAAIKSTLGEGSCLAIVVDQHVGPHDRLWVPFLGLPAATTRVLGRLAVETGAPIVPIHSFPLPRGRCRCEFGPIVDAPRTGDDRADVEAVVHAAIAEMDRATRRMPEAWMWIHRRWKVRPDTTELRYPSYSETETEEAARKARERAIGRSLRARWPKASTRGE